MLCAQIDLYLTEVLKFWPIEQLIPWSSPSESAQLVKKFPLFTYFEDSLPYVDHKALSISDHALVCCVILCYSNINKHE